jgi:hypothetical protein
LKKRGKRETGAFQCVIENDIYKNCERDSYASSNNVTAGGQTFKRTDQTTMHNYKLNVHQQDNEVPVAQGRNKNKH